ncbi:hypothetical protein SARC_03528 [Sphaeroforma arctica JP610]|uniref:Core domain-containing protein n=1 Tax=Sphaeroforma arctica JP610 TaxID=667725 RepID=A0A0L0G5E2_9EUKA|nr:hypothetical protein SARC_03528 [Sphaeroforma arctica JP610]KNC84257.1 hypothetical protein SARC_03528 [Sphaeroforma arctica JP610]|eukprot:XP_014158159.1 hypothetical protein SARC_03528 [Sphaeroforma arctica JP610]
MAALGGAVRTVVGRKLRPSKSVMSITPTAVNHIKDMLKGQDAAAIKIGTLRKGCNGMSYTMSYAKEKAKFDEEVVVDDARVYIDSKALMSIIGSEMDYVDEKLSSGFVFNNPNVKHMCACGESFTV